MLLAWCKRCQLTTWAEPQYCDTCGRFRKPHEIVQSGAHMVGWTFTYSKRGVPMAYCRGWASFVWFGHSQCFKVFVNGQGIGSTKEWGGLAELCAEAKERLCASL